MEDLPKRRVAQKGAELNPKDEMSEWTDESDLSVAGNEWFGAIIYWIIGLCKNPLNTYLSESNRSKNIWTSYTVKLVFTGIVIWLLIRNYN